MTGNQQEFWSSKSEVRGRFMGLSSSRVVNNYRKVMSVSVIDG